MGGPAASIPNATELVNPALATPAWLALPAATSLTPPPAGNTSKLHSGPGIPGRPWTSSAVTGTVAAVQWQTTARGSNLLWPRVVQPETSVTLIPLAFRMAATLRMPVTWKPTLHATLLVLGQYVVLVKRLVFDLGLRGLAVLRRHLPVEGGDLLGAAQVPQPRFQLLPGILLGRRRGSPFGPAAGLSLARLGPSPSSGRTLGATHSSGRWGGRRSGRWGGRRSGRWGGRRGGQFDPSLRRPGAEVEPHDRPQQRQERGDDGLS